MGGKLSLEKVKWALRNYVDHGHQATVYFDSKTGLYGRDKWFWVRVWRGE